MIDYHMPLYRPPSEAASLILQVTLGCSFNRCAFCSMYRSKDYQERPLDQVLEEIEWAAERLPDSRRVFLADGDALALPTEHLAAILEALAGALPRLERVTCYALPANLLKKSASELARLRRLGLAMVYYGIESGSDEILKRITKGASAAAMAVGLEKAAAAGIDVSATVVLGLGGQDLWQTHIDGTAELVNRVPLAYLSTLQLMLEPVIYDEFHTKYARRGGAFRAQDDAGLLAEQARLVAALAPPAPLEFRSNHASNALPLKGVLPQDRDALLDLLGAARDGRVALRPAWARGH